jgi:hypothetical protein
MSIMTRYVLTTALLLTIALASLVFAQRTATNRAQAVPKAAPVTFGKGVRAVDPRAPTPQFSAIAAGLLARPIVDTQSVKGDYAIRVWSLSVGPRTNTAATTLPGAAMLSLTAGKVEFIAGDLRGKLEPGDTVAIPEGASLRFINNDAQRPAVLRAVIVSGV